MIVYYCYDCVSLLYYDCVLLHNVDDYLVGVPLSLSSEDIDHQCPGGPRVGFITGHFIHCPPHLQKDRDSRQSYCSTTTVTPYPCCSPYCPSTLSLGTNFSELLNIQKRESPFFGPSPTNSWPSPFPHFPHRTLNAPGLSSCLDTLSWRTVSVKAGQGEECSYLDLLENSWWPHWAHTYNPVLKWSLKTSPPKKEQNDMAPLAINLNESIKVQLTRTLSLINPV